MEANRVKDCPALPNLPDRETTLKFGETGKEITNVSAKNTNLLILIPNLLVLV